MVEEQIEFELSVDDVKIAEIRAIRQAQQELAAS
jgi:hypothetical protein